MSAFGPEQRAALWRSLRATLLSRDRLRQLITRNFLLKLLSLAIAFSLWFFVNFGERDSEETLRVPLELRNIPAHLMITSPRVDFIDVRVTGPRTLLGRIDHNRLAIPLDLSGVRPGPAVFRVDADALNVPRGVRIDRITPAQLTMELERIAHKTVPVHLRIAGKLPNSLQVADTKVSPETVEVTGPASDVEDVQAANVEPLDVSGAKAGTIERELPLEPAGEYLSFSAARVAAQVRIDEGAVTREFKHVPVAVRNTAGGYRLTPDHVRVVVRGPKPVMENLELDHGAAYVDAQGAGAGEHVVTPTVQLPPQVQLVSIDPAEVHVEIRRQPRAARRRQ